MILLPIINLCIIICFSAFYEAWGFSEKGVEGVVHILGPKIEDHSIWKAFRFFLFIFPLVVFFCVKDWMETGLVVLSPCACFLFLHQFTYNWTEFKLEVAGYKIGLRESPNTTSTKTKTWFRIFCLVCGIIMPIIYLILK